MRAYRPGDSVGELTPWPFENPASDYVILRGSPHMQEVSLGQVASIAKGAQRAEYHADGELVRLIETAARLKGEGNYTAR